jgi:hypothetical protein
MYLTRNQALVKANRGFESHPLRQTQKHPRKGVFLCLAERVGGRTHWFDKIVRNNFAQRKALARSAKRGG